MSITRSKPYHTTQTTWKTILGNTNIIPMNQRNYDWDNEPQIIKFLNDIFDIFETTPYFEKMGTIIYYETIEGKEVWDGQQRMITIILILISISKICNKLSIKEKNANIKSFSESIMYGLKEDTDSMVEETKNIKKFREKFKGFNNIPKLYCVNPYDNDALSRIYNDYEPLIFYENDDIEKEDEDNKDNNDENDSDEYDNNGEENDDSENDDNNNYKNKSYVCKECNEKINIKHKKDRGEIDFIRHLKNFHEYDDSKIKNKDTKIYKAYEFICKILFNKKLDILKLKGFYQFIMNYIDINVYECTDLDYVSKIFEWENNRGKPVNSLDIIKNSLLSNISDDKKDEVFTKWGKLKTKCNSIYSDYGQKIFNCAIQIYNKKINRTFDQEELFKKILQNSDKNLNNYDKNLHNNDKKLTYNEIKKFFVIVNTLFKIMDDIKINRYGRLLLHTKKCCIAWECFSYFILPLFYILEKIDIKIIELVTKWLFRNINSKSKTFNNLCYSNKFIEIINNIIKDNKYNYYDEFEKLLQDQKDELINTKEKYIDKNKKQVWKYTSRTHAKMLLYFYETNITNDDYFPNLDHDLEHIIPESKKDLELLKSIYKLGNLTILESKNSINGHIGNRGIKDGDFYFKKEQYKNSTNKITRELYKFDNFTITEIDYRTKELLTKLYDFTNY